MPRRRLKKYIRKCCCMVFIVLVIFLFYVGYMFQSGRCSTDISLHKISDICERYRRGEIAGSFCQPLCEDKTLHFIKCVNYRDGKTVMFMTCDKCISEETFEIVFKMKWNFDAERLLYVPYIEDETYKQFIENAESLVKDSLKLSHYPFSDGEDILSFAWNWDFNKFVKNQKSKLEASKIAVDSVLSLISQSEYAMSKMLYNYTFIPKIYGSCGPAYFVEKTPTLSQYEFEFFKSFSYERWKERARVAVRLIELMEKLRTFKQDLHLCDMKLDNFGIRNNGEITLIDTDSCFFNNGLMEQFKYSDCTKHSDCDFFDCRGLCDVTSSKCFIKRSNNNMQPLD
ncbi:Family with sequence similarity 69 member C [Mactra antiquata]